MISPVSFKGTYNIDFAQNKGKNNSIWDIETILLKTQKDYIHYNPIKHGYVRKAEEWKYSTFEKYVKQGLYDENWCDFEEYIREIIYE